MSQPAEPRNPFYFLLLITDALSTVTVLALAVVPTLEDRWEKAGEVPPPSPFRDALRGHGLTWALCELGLLIAFGLASMGLDRWRRLKKDRAAATIPPSDSSANDQSA